MTELLRSRTSDILARRSRRLPRLAILIMLGVLAAGSAIWWFYEDDDLPPVSMATAAPQANVPSEPGQASVSELKATQRVAADLIYGLQQTVGEQGAEMKKLADAVAALSGKVDALQRSFASTPSPVAKDAAPKTKKR